MPTFLTNWELFIIINLNIKSKAAYKRLCFFLVEKNDLTHEGHSAINFSF